MPIDPSIVLAGMRQPEQIDPMGVLGKVLTLRNQQAQGVAQQQDMQLRNQQIQENTLKLAGQQRQAAGLEAMSAAVKAAQATDPATGLPTTDHVKVSQLLEQAGYPDLGNTYLQQHLATQESQTKFAQQRAALQQAGIDRIADLASHAIKSLDAKNLTPLQARDTTLASVAHAAADGLISEDDARQFYQNTAGADANTLKQSLQTFVDRSQAVSQRELTNAKTAAETQKATAEAGKATAEVAGTLPATPTQAETARHNAAMERISAMNAGREAAAAAETARHNHATENLQNPFGAATSGGGAGPVSPATGTQGPTGDDFLKTLNPSIAAQVKAYAEGRQPFPTGMSAYRLMPLIQMVTQYDPSFDASNYNARNKARMDLTSPSGTGGKTINALNTALQHAGKLSDLIERLDNYQSPLANAVVNPVRKALGQTAVTNYQAVAPQLAKEIERAWRGSGGSTADIKELIDSIGSNLGLQQQREALGSFVDLLKGKLDATQQQRDNIMGPTAGAAIPVLFDQNKPILSKIEQRAGGAAASIGGSVTVTAPNGKTYTFKSQADADAFKQKAGIK